MSFIGQNGPGLFIPILHTVNDQKLAS